MRSFSRPNLGVASLFLLLAGCGDRTEEEPPLRPVRYEQVFATGGTRTRSFSGTAEASLEYSLSFKVSGTIDQLPVRVGDRVRASDLIAVLDAEDYRVQVHEAEAALSQAQAQERNAKASYERVRLLYENNNASKSELDAARAGYESAAASVEAADQRLRLSRLKLGYTRLRAPVDGAVASRHVEVNEHIQPGRPIVMLTSGSRLKVKVAVPGVLIGQIREGNPVNVSFDALPARAFTAKITEVGVAATEVGSTFPVMVLLDEEDEAILSGMSAEVAFRFESEDDRERFVVPTFAVSEDRGGRFVFVVEPTENGRGIVLRRAVQVGELTAGGIEIFDGLEDGDLLVTAGISRIQDGLQVRLSPDEQTS